MIKINTSNLSAQQKNLISKLNIEIQKQPKNKQWQGFSFFARSFGNQKQQYDLVLLTNANILCVEFCNVNGQITSDQYNNWWVNNERLSPSPLTIGGKKARKLTTEIEAIKHQLHNADQLVKNPHFLPKVLNLVVMTGKADWSALNGIPFVDRILSFEDFCQLIPNEDFYLHFFFFF